MDRNLNKQFSFTRLITIKRLLFLHTGFTSIWTKIHQANYDMTKRLLFLHEGFTTNRTTIRI